ncbi:hypothetical protein HanRHA438_Chr02g0047031 [Helianthus annuus]|nr:hypothetical protein HanRHA438_Chr02g0047031 [Helianthus annuus]
MMIGMMIVMFPNPPLVFCIFLVDSLISCKCKNMMLFGDLRSSTETEYRAMAVTRCDIV